MLCDSLVDRSSLVGEEEDFYMVLNLKRFLRYSGFSGSLGTLLLLLKSDMSFFCQKTLVSQEFLFPEINLPLAL